MKNFLKNIVALLLIISCLDAKVGVCEVQPESKKEQYLECLIKEAKRTDDIANINMVAHWYGVYILDKKMFSWYDKSIKKGDAEAMYKAARRYDTKKFNQPKKAIELYKKAAGMGKFGG